MLEALAQHVDDAAFADLSLEPREELLACWRIVAKVQRLNQWFLRCLDESVEFRWTTVQFRS